MRLCLFMFHTFRKRRIWFYFKCAFLKSHFFCYFRRCDLNITVWRHRAFCVRKRLKFERRTNTIGTSFLQSVAPETTQRCLKSTFIAKKFGDEIASHDLRESGFVKIHRNGYSGDPNTDHLNTKCFSNSVFKWF